MNFDNSHFILSPFAITQSIQLLFHFNNVIFIDIDTDWLVYVPIKKRFQYFFCHAKWTARLERKHDSEAKKIVQFFNMFAASFRRARIERMKFFSLCVLALKKLSNSWDCTTSWKIKKILMTTKKKDLNWWDLNYDFHLDYLRLTLDGRWNFSGQSKS